MKSIINALAIALIVFGCNSPKVIEADTAELQNRPFEFSDIPEDHKISFEEASTEEPLNASRKVTVQEVLPTTKYVYLRVEEGKDVYWLATKKMEVEVGAIYYYRNGLLKTNFESKEYQRTFEKLYLVSTIVPENHGNSNERKNIEMHAFEGSNKMAEKKEISVNSEVTSIAELVRRKEQFVGKKVTIQGKCTKVNSKIMGRNWIHLKDGSMDDYDLVITSNAEVPVGHTITMVGTVSLQKDFGSGYYYELLIENGSLIQQ